MKCKKCRNEMIFIIGDEFVDVYECIDCDLLAVMIIELSNFVQWYKHEYDEA